MKFWKTLVLGVAVSFLPFSTAILAPAYAQQKLVYDYAEGKWVKRDVRKYRRNPPAKYNRRTVPITTDENPGTIIIDTRKKFLYYVVDDRKAIRYGVGVGREGFGWSGEVKVQRKAKWPSWSPPPEMIAREWAQNKRRLPRVQKGGPDNPLGARALYLFKGRQDTQYRIHGTNEPWSIGLNMSSGCIRMLNPDVEDLYNRTKVGSKVVVIGPDTRNAGKIYSEFSNPLSFLFGGKS
jgi:lipoprotein-anchoring transpeptidase ErfK/SrfK